MKKYLCLLVFSLILSKSFAQCNIDFSQTVPGLYPDTLPTGYVGQPYSEDITFVLPTDTMGYQFLNFKIVSITLPVGLSWQCNNFANGCNYDPQSNIYGCVNVYGSPLLAGQYQIEVSVIADLDIVSGYPFSFQVFMEVLPDNTPVSNNGFSMTGSVGCMPVTVNFTNNNPGLTAYEWDFGNGNTSTLENPAPQIYTTPGDYVVNYTAWSNTTSTDVYTLTGVTINTIQNVFSWGYPTELNPDPYIVIKENGNTVYSSTYYGDTPAPVSWTFSLNMNVGSTYTMEVWDEDDYEIFYGGDDLIGTHTMNFNGCSGCAAGSDAIVSYNINHVIIPPTPAVVSVDTVHVSGYPGEPNIVFDSINHVLVTDSTSNYLQWYFNYSPVSNANDDSLVVDFSGEYYVIAINNAGCVASSDTITAIYCSGIAPVVNLNGNVLSTPDTTGNSFQWHDANGPISGATNNFYGVTIAGDYHVVVTDEYGCVYISNDVNVPLSILESEILNIEIYPNPADQFVMIHLNSAEFNSVSITDVAGRNLVQISNPTANLTIDVSEFNSGVYFILCEQNGKRIAKKMVIE